MNLAAHPIQGGVLARHPKRRGNETSRKEENGTHANRTRYKMESLSVYIRLSQPPKRLFALPNWSKSDRQATLCWGLHFFSLTFFFFILSVLSCFIYFLNKALSTLERHFNIPPEGVTTIIFLSLRTSQSSSLDTFVIWYYCIPPEFSLKMVNF